MKKFLAVLAVAVLAGCATQEFDMLDTTPQGSQVTSNLGLGGISITATGLPVTSGNGRAIPSGQAGSGQ